MIRSLFCLLSNLSTLLLVALSAVCLSGTHLGSVRTVGWMATFTDRYGNIGLAIFLDGSADTSGRVFEPFRDTEIVASNIQAWRGRSGELSFLGLVVAPAPVVPPLRCWVIFVPWKWWLILLGILPISRFIIWGRARYIRAARYRAGCCCTCGYDLRASKDRCPECGEPIPTPSVKAIP